MRVGGIAFDRQFGVFGEISDGGDSKAVHDYSFDRVARRRWKVFARVQSV
jgi:hypothetical protein